MSILMWIITGLFFICLLIVLAFLIPYLATMGVLRARKRFKEKDKEFDKEFPT